MNPTPAIADPFLARLVTLSADDLTALATLAERPEMATAADDQAHEAARDRLFGDAAGQRAYAAACSRATLTLLVGQGLGEAAWLTWLSQPDADFLASAATSALAMRERVLAEPQLLTILPLVATYAGARQLGLVGDPQISALLG
jgi:hypothetical protein